MSRPALTHAAVVDCARSLIRAEGVDAVSLRRVARELGVTAPALYAYVRDYDSLLAEVAAGELGAMQRQFGAVGGADPISRLRRLGRTYVAHAREEPHLHRLTFRYPPAAVSGGDGGGFGPATEAYAAALEPIEQAIAADLLAADDPVLVALTLWSAVHGVAEVLLMGLGLPEATADALVVSVVDGILDGLRRRPAEDAGPRDQVVG
ncbi:MAG TPA: TetR/AcrR family transcriptional regulator [Acidimicrobiales bacterium]|nr:TetR/AcrR family transcriptional regulator [Acidimicrobiales bacterium]